MCSEKTLYNYVDAQLFDIRNIDLLRKVKYLPRYKRPEFKVDRGCRIGRNYAGFPAGCKYVCFCYTDHKSVR